MLKYTIALILLTIFSTTLTLTLAHHHNPVTEGSLYNQGLTFYVFAPGSIECQNTDVFSCNYVSNFTAGKTNYNKYKCTGNETTHYQIKALTDYPLYISHFNYDNLGAITDQGNYDYLVPFTYPFMGYTYWTTINFVCPLSAYTRKGNSCVMKLNSVPLGLPSAGYTTIIFDFELTYTVN